MTIYPAIDLYEGKAVRLKRGDYEQMTIYSDDPVSVALGFKENGATALHVVDLEGARIGKPVNYQMIKKIAAETGMFIQVGGGIRNQETINRYLGIGINRVILGTAAVSKPDLMREMAEKYDNAVAISVDIKEGFVAIKGWTEVSNQNALNFCSAVENLGVQTLICTDVTKDGMLKGTNMELYHVLRSKLIIELIASGGITTLEEIKTLSKQGIDGAILGRAIYTGDINLNEAVNASKKGNNDHE